MVATIEGLHCNTKVKLERRQKRRHIFPSHIILGEGEREEARVGSREGALGLARVLKSPPSKLMITVVDIAAAVVHIKVRD